MGSLEVFLDTWTAMSRPRRLVPILIVGAPLIVAQWWYTNSAPGTAVGVAMLLSFLALGPASWRVLFPSGRDVSVPVVRALIYAALGIIAIGGTGLILPKLLGVYGTFLTVDPSLAIMLGLFWVGGWGLGRDIDLEMQIAQEKARAAALQQQMEHAQLLALKNHLDPHFLFNTINAIAEWCQEDPAVAEAALLRLATMLRTMLSGITAPTWPLREELALLDDLLALHAVRDPDRFQVRREGWDAVPDLAIPPLLLLPVVENAMKHGPAAGHAGEVSVEIEVQDHFVVVQIENPGPYTGPRPGGQGIDMVKQRLALTWGRRASLELADVGGRTRARIALPLSTLPPAPDSP